jgi:hypothetical protein
MDPRCRGGVVAAAPGSAPRRTADPVVAARLMYGTTLTVRFSAD